jgi:molybdate transport system ATP-binding protein
VIEARVARQEPRWHLTELQFAGGRLTVPESPLPEGGTARVRIGARDVSLALRAPVDTSILNVLQAQVTELAPDGPGQVLVRLDCGGQPLLARITAKSAERLGLEPGSDVHAQVKSLALLR